MHSRIYASLLILFFSSHLFAQESKQSSVYHINWWKDGVITALACGGNYAGLAILTNKPSEDSSFVLALDPNDVNSFDRPATRISPEYAPTADNLSNIGLTIGFFIPGVLALDRKVRQDWGEVLLLYAQTAFLNGNLYAWGSATHVDRIRPIAYNQAETISNRLAGDIKNSFYSGHTAYTATGTFFVAKVLSDYHPEWGKKRAWLFVGASVLPLGVAYMRFRAGKHF